MRYNVPGGVLNWEECAGLAITSEMDPADSRHFGPMAVLPKEQIKGMPAASDPSLYDLALKEGALEGEEPHVLKREQQDRSPHPHPRFWVSSFLGGKNQVDQKVCVWPGCLISASLGGFNSKIVLAEWKKLLFWLAPTSFFCICLGNYCDGSLWVRERHLEKSLQEDSETRQQLTCSAQKNVPETGAGRESGEQVEMRSRDGRGRLWGSSSEDRVARIRNIPY